MWAVVAQRACCGGSSPWRDLHQIPIRTRCSPTSTSGGRSERRGESMDQVDHDRVHGFIVIGVRGRTHRARVGATLGGCRGGRRGAWERSALRWQRDRDGPSSTRGFSRAGWPRPELVSRVEEMIRYSIEGGSRRDRHPISHARPRPAKTRVHAPGMDHHLVFTRSRVQTTTNVPGQLLAERGRVPNQLTPKGV